MNICKKFLLTSTLLFASSAAMAGGYQLNDYSVTNLGRAFAGVGVVGDDYSALAYNPAGMSLMKSGVQMGATVVQLKSDVTDLDNTARNPGTIRLYSPLPHFFGQYKINDKWDVGFGIYTPFGLSTKYKSNWFGAAYGIKSELVMVDFAPAVSYKVLDSLTLGASFIVRYISGNITNTVDNGTGTGFPGSWSEFDLDGWTVTGSLGMMWEPVKDTRFGLSWRLKSTQQVKGDHDLTTPLGSGTFSGRASPDLPETFTFSAFQKVGDFGLSGTARWTHWGASFPKFTLESQYPGATTTQNYKWDNSWTITGGVDYYLNKNWTLRFGGGWDESPSHSSTNRTVRIPDNDRIWAALGFSYKCNNWTTDVGYSHMFMKTTQVHEMNKYGTAQLNAKYDSQGNILGVQVQYTF